MNCDHRLRIRSSDDLSGRVSMKVKNFQATQRTVSFLRITLLRKSISGSSYYDVSEKPATSIFLAEDICN
jgi:hypothetical protein